MVAAQTVFLSDSKLDARPVRPVSPDTLWDRAVRVRDDFARQIREVLQQTGIEALVYSSQNGNYPPWVKLEGWLPIDQLRPAVRQRVDLEFVIDVKPFNVHQIIQTARLTKGKKKISVSERGRFTQRDVLEWTRFALGAGPKPSNYTPGQDLLLSIPGLIIPPLRPHRNRIAKEYRRPFFTTSMFLIAGIVLAQLLGSASGRNPALAGLSVLLMLGSVIGFIWLAFAAYWRKKIVAVPMQPLAPPRNPGLVDSWNAVVPGLGGDYVSIKRRLLTKLAEVQAAGAECRAEVYSYRTPNGYEERERLVLSKGQSLVHVHIVQFGNDVYVGWQAHLNWAGWGETNPAATRTANGAEIEYRELRPGFYVPQTFDLIDLNSLSELVHRRIEDELKAVLREKQIDQEIDFQIVRGDRENALDRSKREGPEEASRLSRFWPRFMKSAQAWQMVSMTEVKRTVADPKAVPAAAASTTSGSLIPLALAAGALLYWASPLNKAFAGTSIPASTVGFAALVGLALWWYGELSIRLAAVAAVIYGFASYWAFTAYFSRARELITGGVQGGFLLYTLGSVLLGTLILMATGSVFSARLRSVNRWLFAVIVWSAIPLLFAYFRQNGMANDVYMVALAGFTAFKYGCFGYWLQRPPAA